MSSIGSVEMLLEAGWVDAATGRTGAVVGDPSLHAELNAAAATSGMAANLAAREVRADMRSIETVLDG